MGIAGKPRYSPVFRGNGVEHDGNTAVRGDGLSSSGVTSDLRSAVVVYIYYRSVK